MKYKLVILIAALALSSCAAPSPTLSPITPSQSATNTPLPTSSPSSQIIPTRPPHVPATSSFPGSTRIPPTPTISATSLGICPIEDPELKISFDMDELTYNPYPVLSESTLNFLNQGGTTKELENALNQYWRGLYIGDMTGDAIPEIGIYDNALRILGCVDGTYRELGNYSSANPNLPRIYGVQDMNLNGSPDLVIYNSDSCGFLGRCSEVTIYEWHKTEFRILTRDAFDGDNSLRMLGPFNVEVRDIDNNGTLELLLEQIPS